MLTLRTETESQYHVATLGQMVLAVYQYKDGAGFERYVIFTTAAEEEHFLVETLAAQGPYGLLTLTVLHEGGDDWVPIREREEATLHRLRRLLDADMLDAPTRRYVDSTSPVL